MPTLTGSLFDWTFALHVETADVAGAIESLFLGGVIRDDLDAERTASQLSVRAQAEQFVLLQPDHQPIVLASVTDAALSTVSTIELMAAAHSPTYVAIHAGVVQTDHGAILLPGRSHAGKTTLTASLVDAGAVYFSDEYALLDRKGMVYAYPRPLRMRSRGDNGAVTLIPPVELPDRALDQPS